jgi:lysophospholipase L1-like esterase
MQKIPALLLLVTLFAAAAAQTPPPTTPAHVDASAPIMKVDPSGKFLNMHERFLARRTAGPIGVLFLGDSITEGWTKAPHVWQRYYGKIDPANFGIGGDQTQHVVWRIEHGELEGIHPKVTVLLLGTNNTGDHTADEIFAADKKIVDLIRVQTGSKVLLLAIFPRGAGKDAQGNITAAATADATKRTAVINAANAQLAKLDDGKDVRFLDIGEKFLGQDNKIPFPIMPDQLHPTAAGYQLWADAMQPLLTEMMK